MIEMVKINNNLELYNNLKTVPENAKREIKTGRLKGKTDINPMWRIKRLTEQFGVCGFGWKTKTINKWIEEGGNGEKSAFVDIELYIKINDEWSEAIESNGGSSFVANEKNGLYTSDECFKMAFTDALSVACKMIGIGADVYWEADKTKYTGQNKREVETELDTDILKKVKKIIWHASDKDEKKAIDMLEEYTKFIGKDGKEVTGVRDFNKLSNGRLRATYGKLQKLFPELYKTVKEEIKNKKEAS